MESHYGVRIRGTDRSVIGKCGYLCVSGCRRFWGIPEIQYGAKTLPCVTPMPTGCSLVYLLFYDKKPVTQEGPQIVENVRAGSPSLCYRKHCFFMSFTQHFVKMPDSRLERLRNSTYFRFNVVIDLVECSVDLFYCSVPTAKSKLIIWNNVWLFQNCV